MTRRRAAWALIGLVLALPSAALALQRNVQARIAAYDDAPIDVQHASAKLVRTYSAPTQFPVIAATGERAAPSVKRSRVRYMNQLDQEVPTFLLEGRANLKNRTRKRVSAVQMTTVLMNAFGERLGSERRSITEPFGPMQAREIVWATELPHEDVYEVYIVVSSVRYDDGTVWTPTEELVLSP